MLAHRRNAALGVRVTFARRKTFVPIRLDLICADIYVFDDKLKCHRRFSTIGTNMPETWDLAGARGWGETVVVERQS